MDSESTYWQDGEAHHETARREMNRRQVFTPKIIYNLLAMAIEKYFMPFFEAHKSMPANHTFTHLIHCAYCRQKSGKAAP